MHFYLREHYTHFKNFNPQNCPPPPSARGEEGMIEGVIGTSIGVGRAVTGSICLESSAESREYNVYVNLFLGDGNIFSLG